MLKTHLFSIGKTLQASGFNHVEQYHDNVPSFGEWGWSIASKMGASPSQRLKTIDSISNDDWLTKDLLLSSFHFPANFYEDAGKVKINYLGSHQVYQYHQAAWQSQQGLNNATFAG